MHMDRNMKNLLFDYGGILKKNFAYEIKRPKKDRKLPVVLSRMEFFKILSSVVNIKHRAILMITYSAGLRVGEVVRLRVKDIDTERKIIHVRGVKGMKDRYTILLDVAIEMLNLYLKSYQPEKWLFHGKNENSHLTVRSVEKIFDNAVRSVGVTKNVFIHSLKT